MKKHLSFIATAWMLAVSTSLIWNLNDDEREQVHLSLQTARSFFHQIVIDRAWNASAGGIYVPVTDGVQPNPYLSVPNRDITTTDGLKLTLINPSFMTRQIAELADKKDGVKFHITSNKPIRPENKPNEWEAAWLKSFEQGATEQYALDKDADGFKFKYMAPLVVKSECLGCHQEQGYKAGDIRGGISIVLPFKSRAINWPLWISHSLGLILGLFGIFVSGYFLNRSRNQLLENNKQLIHEIEERKHIESVLQESEKLYRSLVETTSAVAWEVDINTQKFTYISPRVVEIFGYPINEWNDIAFWADHIHQDDKDFAVTYCQTETTIGRDHDFEYRFIAADGRELWVRDIVSVISEGGKPVTLQGYLLDITKYKQAELDLKKSEERFDIAVEGSSDGIWDWVDVNKDEYWLAPRVYEMLGYEKCEISAKVTSLKKLVHPDDLEFVSSALENHLKNKTPYDVEHRLLTKADGYHWFRGRGQAIWNHAGRAVRMAGSIQDISEQKDSIIKVQQAKDEWEKTFDAISDIITIQDKDMKIFRVNKGAARFFQCEPQDLLGKHCYELFRCSTGPCTHCPSLTTLSDKVNHTEIIKNESLKKVLSVTSSAVLDENGDFKFLVHIARDITEQMKMEEDLLQSHKMEAMGTLAGGIAHDFNNMLTAIIGYAQLVQAELPEGKTLSHVEQIFKAGGRAKELVKQILTFSRKGSHEVEPLKPHLIVNESLKLLRSSLPSTIEIKEHIDKESGSILADPTKVHQVMVNLCTNALHAMEDEKGCLEVSLTRKKITKKDLGREKNISPGVFVELSITDSGKGIESGVLERIFEPYFTTKEAGKGTGMGLAMVHGIIKEHEGFIKVKSKVGEGTTFLVYFPMVELKSEKQLEENVLLVPRGNEKILVVDDENFIGEFLQESFERLGYHVVYKESSIGALEEFTASPEDFDLVITDQTMPIMAGSDLAPKLLEIRPDIPIILCTGFSNIINSEEAKNIGFRDFFMKPVDMRQLAFKVREILDEKK